MNPVPTRGLQSSQLWFVGWQPSEKDEAIGKVFGDSVGYHLDKMIREARLPDAFFCTVQPFAKQDIDNDFALQLFQTRLNTTKPPIIVTCDSRYEKKLSKKTGEEKENEKIWVSDVLRMLCPSTNGILNKYAGSILTSPFIPHPHYIIPTYSPYFIWRNYDQREITVQLDYGHIREEYEYYRRQGVLQDLPSYRFIVEPSYSELMDYLLYLKATCKLVSADIETIRPPKSARTKGSKYDGIFKGHPGYPYTLGLAPSSKEGISFSLWDYSDEQLIKIWREVDYILSNIAQVGQNYFVFDYHMLSGIGFDPQLSICKDTLIRHHILHPELPHKLQFQTRQYTRQPYYKDEGKQWTVKNKKSLMKYNALDVVVTYEIYEQQELEFNDRPHLR
jgi:hypothetical protein